MTSVLTILKKAWPHTIRGQLIVGIALVHLLLMTIFVSNLFARQKTFLRNHNYEHAFAFANNFANNAAAYLISNEFDELERLTQSQLNLPNLKYAMILSPDGVVLAHTDLNVIG